MSSQYKFQDPQAIKDFDADCAEFESNRKKYAGIRIRPENLCFSMFDGSKYLGVRKRLADAYTDRMGHIQMST